MQTSGLVLDLYDNPQDLKAIFPSPDVIPEAVKTAHALSSVERDELPDDVFALVLMNGPERLRKYACVDEGNTMLNLAYFFKHGHKLPLEAQKTAAVNLQTACGWYGIEVPEELEKVALGLGTVATALAAPSVIKGTGSQIRGNLAAARDAGGVVITPREQAAVGSMLKSAEVAGTELQSIQPPSSLSSAGARGKPGSSNTSAMKTATLTLVPHVSVTGQSAPERVVEKRASRYAYAGMYPLDSYLQVKQASRYFDENFLEMELDMRHEFAVNLLKTASQIGIECSDEVATYGATDFASDEQVKVALDLRRPYLNEKQAQILDKIYDHRAELGPVDFCETLGELDKLAEITWRYDRAFPNPIISTHGLRKFAADEGDSWMQGNDYITKKQIENYAVTALLSLTDDYGPDFAKEFQKDPWGIFSSLPADQKRRLARAAGDNSATGMHDVA